MRLKTGNHDPIINEAQIKFGDSFIMKRIVPAMIIVMAMLIALLPLSESAGEVGFEDDPATTDALISEKEAEVETEAEPDTDAGEETENDEAEGEEKAPEASVSASMASLGIYDYTLETLSNGDPSGFDCGCETDCNNPLMIDSACYNTLSSAIEAVQNGQVIQLRGDVEDSGNVTVNSEVTFTIESNGHRLVINAQGNSTHSGELTIRSGANVSIDGDISSKIAVSRGGKLNITGSVTVRSSSGNFDAIEITGVGSEITVGGSLTLTSDNGGERVGINAEDGARVTVKGDIAIVAGQNEKIGIKASNATVTVGGDIRGVTGGVVAGWSPGGVSLPTDVTVNGTISATSYDVLWSLPNSPAAVGVDEGDGYLTYRAVRNSGSLIVRVAQAHKCINLCDDCNECLTCSECICPIDIPPPGTGTGTETGEVTGTGTGEGAGAGTAIVATTAATAASTDDDDDINIEDNETPLAAALVDDADNADDADSADAAAGTGTDTGAGDAIVIIEDEEIPLVPGIIDGDPHSLFTMMFASLGILAALALSTILTIKTKKLERSYKGFDEKKH